MARYVCTLCGEIYDEEKEGVRFEDLLEDWACPVCGSPKNCFVLDKSTPADEVPVSENAPSGDESGKGSAPLSQGNQDLVHPPPSDMRNP